jgi:hypothetical protein
LSVGLALSDPSEVNRLVVRDVPVPPGIPYPIHPVDDESSVASIDWNRPMTPGDVDLLLSADLDGEPLNVAGSVNLFKRGEVVLAFDDDVAPC